MGAEINSRGRVSIDEITLPPDPECCKSDQLEVKNNGDEKRYRLLQVPAGVDISTYSRGDVGNKTPKTHDNRSSEDIASLYQVRKVTTVTKDSTLDSHEVNDAFASALQAKSQPPLPAVTMINKEIWHIPSGSDHLKTPYEKVQSLSDVQIDAIITMLSDETDDLKRYLSVQLVKKLTKNIPFKFEYSGEPSWGGICKIIKLMKEQYESGADKPEQFTRNKRTFVANLVQEIFMSGNKNECRAFFDASPVSTAIRLTFRDSKNTCDEAIHLLAWLTNNALTESSINFRFEVPETRNIVMLEPIAGAYGSECYLNFEKQIRMYRSRTDADDEKQAVRALKTLGISKLSQENLDKKHNKALKKP